MELLEQSIPPSLPIDTKSDADDFTRRVSKGIQRASNGLTTAKTGALIQVWMPDTCSGGRVLLQTKDLPFSISGVGDLLALFRCISCRYRFDTDPVFSSSMGAIGRVYHSGNPEMCLDVQQYDKNTYLRIKEAQACQIHSTLIMPLFHLKASRKPVAVVEVSHHDKEVQFNSIIQLLKESLEMADLYTADIQMDQWKLGLRKWPADVCSVSLLNLEELEECNYQKYPQEKGISNQHSLGKAMQTGFGDVSDFLLNIGVDSLTFDNFYFEDFNEGYCDSNLEVNSPTKNNDITQRQTRNSIPRCLSDRSSTSNNNNNNNNTNEGVTVLPVAYEEETQHGGCQAQVAQLLAQANEANAIPLIISDSPDNRDLDTNMLDVEENLAVSGLTLCQLSNESSENEKANSMPTSSLLVNTVSPITAADATIDATDATASNDIGKKNENRLGGGAGRRLSYKDLEAHFGHGLKEAANRLGICPTTLKRACRRNGISRWPSRQISKLTKVWKQMGYKGQPPGWLLQSAISGNLRSDNLAYILNAGFHVGLQHPASAINSLSSARTVLGAPSEGVGYEQNPIIKNKTHHGAFTSALHETDSFVFEGNHPLALDQHHCNNTWHGGQTIQNILCSQGFITTATTATQHSLNPYITTTNLGFNDCTITNGDNTKTIGAYSLSKEDSNEAFSGSIIEQRCRITTGSSLSFELDKAVGGNGCDARERLQNYQESDRNGSNEIGIEAVGSIGGGGAGGGAGGGMIPVLPDFAIVDHDDDDDDILHEQFTNPLGYDPSQHLFP